jgi:hypothetical protein
MKLLKWLQSRDLEFTIFVIGIVLRLTMTWNYHVKWAYDADDHWEVVQWIAAHGRVPPPEAVVEAFHPPLWYAFVAWLINHGAVRSGMVWLSLAFGVLRLALIWAGLELYVKGSRFARVVGLALAAFIYAGVHIDGMVYPEALSCLWCALVMFLIPMAFRRREFARWPLTFAIGLVLGLAMLTKISALAVVAALGLAVLVELLFSRRTLSERVANMLPWVSTIVVVLAMSGWYFARNIRDYGRPFITSFDLPSQHFLVEEAQKRDFLDRRTLGFVLGWDESIFIYPFSQYGIGPNPRFFPVAIATTFEDFWGYGFVGFDRPIPKKGVRREGRPPASYARIASLSVIGGTVIALSTLIAWLGAWRHLFRSRDFGRLALLLVPLVTVAAALHFAIAHPADGHGVTKGIYMTFGAPPLYALFGVAAAWAQRKRERWPVLGVMLVALALVAVYTFDCRLGLYLLE